MFRSWCLFLSSLADRNFILVGLPAPTTSTPPGRSQCCSSFGVLTFDFVAATTTTSLTSSRYYTGYVSRTERVNFKLALMALAYRVQHGMAPAYLNQLVPVSDLPGRHRLNRSCIYTRAVRSVISSDNHWPSLVSCYSHNCLEHFACPCPVITIYCNLSPAAEDILVPTAISGHHHLTLLCMYRGLRNGFCYSSHVKNLWLIDWLFVCPSVCL